MIILQTYCWANSGRMPDSSNFHIRHWFFLHVVLYCTDQSPDEIISLNRGQSHTLTPQVLPAAAFGDEEVEEAEEEPEEADEVLS